MIRLKYIYYNNSLIIAEYINLPNALAIEPGKRNDRLFGFGNINSIESFDKIFRLYTDIKSIFIFTGGNIDNQCADLLTQVIVGYDLGDIHIETVQGEDNE